MDGAGDPLDPASCRPLSLTARLSLGLLCIVGLVVAHPYRGIWHDARLYLLQALAHVNPESLGHDVFLAYGSQDRFTLYSGPVAALMRLTGPETAAALLTTCFQAALLAAAWFVARGAAARRLALAGVAVFASVRASYGYEGVFSIIEAFLTPRMAAEALVLAGAGALLRGRPAVAAALLAAAAACHPLIAVAGGVLAACWLALGEGPGRSWILPVGGVALLGGIAAAASTGLLDAFDPHWLALVTRRSPILFLGCWSLTDWTPTVIAATTLATGARSLPEPAGRRLCLAALATLLLGLLVAGLAGDVLHLVRFTQLQPWRWQWIGLAIAALILPSLVVRGWQRGATARITIALVLAGWLLAGESTAIAVMGLAGLSLLAPAGLPRSVTRLLLGGAAGILLIALAWRIGSTLQFTEAYLLDPRWPLAVRMTMSAAADGALVPLAALLVVASDGWVRAGARHLVAGTVLVAGILVVATVLPVSARTFGERDLPAIAKRALAPFRAIIPPGTDVLWNGPGAASWVLLERPNYLLPATTAGMLYSREAAMEMERRALSLSPTVPLGQFLDFHAPEELVLAPAQERAICLSGAVPYLVSRDSIGLAPVASAAIPGQRADRALKLYRCGAGSRTGGS